MTFDYSKLSGRIREKFKTQEDFAAAVKLSAHSISKKLTGKSKWKQIEIFQACLVLEIPMEKIHEYFFKEKVQYIEH